MAFDEHAQEFSEIPFPAFATWVAIRDKNETNAQGGVSALVFFLVLPIGMGAIGNLGAHIQKARLQKNLSQEEAAKRAGILQVTVSRIERGESAELASFFKLAETLGLNLQKLTPKLFAQIGEQIKAAREGQGLTQAQLSRRTKRGRSKGVSALTILFIENAKSHNYRLKTLMTIIRALGFNTLKQLLRYQPNPQTGQTLENVAAKDKKGTGYKKRLDAFKRLQKVKAYLEAHASLRKELMEDALMKVVLERRILADDLDDFSTLQEAEELLGNKSISSTVWLEQRILKIIKLHKQGKSLKGEKADSHQRAKIKSGKSKQNRQVSKEIIRGPFGPLSAHQAGAKRKQMEQLAPLRAFFEKYPEVGAIVAEHPAKKVLLEKRILVNDITQFHSLLEIAELEGLQGSSTFRFLEKGIKKLVQSYFGTLEQRKADWLKHFRRSDGKYLLPREEKEYLSEFLVKHHRDVEALAKTLGPGNRTTLLRKLSRYQLVEGVNVPSSPWGRTYKHKVSPKKEDNIKRLEPIRTFLNKHPNIKAMIAQNDKKAVVLNHRILVDNPNRFKTHQELADMLKIHGPDVSRYEYLIVTFAQSFFGSLEERRASWL